MSPSNDPEIEALLAEVAATEAERDAILEEHRLLEHDLSRLSDPLPPPDFLAQVMNRVATAPPPDVSRSDITAAISIVCISLIAALGALWASGETGQVGLTFAAWVLKGREALIAGASALAAVWKTAALPTVVGLSMVLGATLTVMRRLMPAQASQAVIP